MRLTMTQITTREPALPLLSSKRWSWFSSANYPYVCARVRAKRASLLPEDTYRKLLVMDIHEITRFLGESHYKREITDLGISTSGYQLIETALNRNIAEVYQQILGYCEGDLARMLSAYLEREDIWNIKAILRGKSYHAKPEEIMKAVRSTGKYPEQYWRDIVSKTKTVQETIEHLKGNDYYDIVQTFIQDWENHPEECENKLEHTYYQCLLNSVHTRSEPNQLFIDFIREEIDLVNIKTLCMTKFESVEPVKIRSLMIPGGKIPDNIMNFLINAPDFEHFLEECKKMQDYHILHDSFARVKQTGSLSHLIRQLEKNHLTKATKKSYLHPLSILPILDYIIRKRIEVENLRIISRAKEKGLSDQVIRELLVSS
jgi:V/A-type H+-transporting ATPase subunit C